MNKNSDNSNTDDVVLDEELQCIENEINETKQFLDNAENPKELTLSHQLDDKTIESMYDQIRKMPINEMMKLLANLAKSNQMPDHKFTTVTDTSRDNMRTRLKEKLKQLEMMRTKKSVLNNHTKKAELDKKKDETVQSTVPILLKSQKNRLLKKKSRDAKLKATQESNEISPEN